jgi:hypothetical protein
LDNDIEVTPNKLVFNKEATQHLINPERLIDTISAASIQDDEEGTNLNAKGINTDYVKHYNSINKTRGVDMDINAPVKIKYSLQECVCSHERIDTVSSESSHCFDTVLECDTLSSRVNQVRFSELILI